MLFGGRGISTDKRLMKLQPSQWQKDWRERKGTLQDGE